MLGKGAQMKMTSKLLKEEVGPEAFISSANPEARENFNKSDVSFPHEPGAGTMEKATLVKLRSSETRLKFAIKALDILCTTKVETLNWEKLERLQEHWNRYEDSLNAYQMLINQYSVAAAKHFFTLLEAFAAVDQRARTLFEISLSGGSVNMDKGDEDKVKAEEVKNIAKQRLTNQDQLWQPWMSEVQEKAKLGPEAKEVRAAMRAKLNLVIKVETKMDQMQHAQDEAVQLKMKDQGLEEEEKMFKEEMDLEAYKLLAVQLIESRSKEYFAEAAEEPPDFKKLMLRQLNLNTKEVEKHADARQLNYMMKAEAETMVERMHITLEEELRLKEEKVSRYAIDWHELIADKLVPPSREWSGAEAQASVSSVNVEEISAKDRLDEVEKVWQGSVPLVIDKQDQVEVSLSKVEMMHALKAEAVQLKNTEVKLMEDKLMQETLMKLLNVKDEAEQLIEPKVKLMKEELLEFCKQYPEVKECEKEGHEAPPLLVDKQAADAG